MSTNKQKQPLSKKAKVLFSIAFWFVFILGVGSIVGVFSMINHGKLGYIPPYEEIENPKNKSATQIYSADNKVIGKFFLAKENRTSVTFDQLPTALVDALVATEDSRFYTHSGIDFRSLGRVLVKTLILQSDNAGGGSTITQQLAKQMWSNPAQNRWQRAFQKLNEWVISIRLERYFTKEEIIAMYFNKYDFLYNAVGIETAANVYFGKTLMELTPDECAIFVGMCKNPILYNPLRKVDRMLGRRNVVLHQMLLNDYLTEEQYETLSQKPIVTNFNRVDHKSGVAPYFREYVRKTMQATKPIRNEYSTFQAYYEDSIQWSDNALYGWLNKNTKPDGSKYKLYTDGLRIHSTIDYRMQTYANNAVKQHLSQDLQPDFFAEKESRSYAPYSRQLGDKGRDLNAEVLKLLDRAMRNTDRYRSLRKQGKSQAEIKEVFDTPVETSVFSWNGVIDTVLSPMDSIRYMKHFLRSGFLSMEPQTGHVKAYVGGYDYSYFQYDMVTQGKRQVGSTIKPFLYTMAMQDGYTPCYEVRNTEYTLIDGNGKPWTAKDTGKEFLGDMVTLKWGLANSNNHISAWLMQQFKPDAFAKTIHSFGIVSHIDPVPAMCLGTSDVSLAEMVSGYSTFANAGVHTQPIVVTRIEDRNGNLISNITPHHEEVIDAKTAYLMLDLLQGVVRQGTGRRLRSKYGLTNQIGGKTGTSQNQSDGWFMGVTPNLVSGVWVGGEERSIHFDGIVKGQGANMSLPIWGLYMQQVYADSTLRYSSEDEFQMPSNFNINLNCDQLPSSGTGGNTLLEEEEDEFM